MILKCAQEAISKLEQISDAFASVELSDLQALSNLHTKFTEVYQLPLDEQIRCLASLCADMVEKIILDEYPDARAVMNTISDNIAEMKSLVTMEKSVEVDITHSTKQLPTDNSPESTTEETKPQECETPTSFDTEVEISSINADESLLGEFITEATEHLQTADDYLLQLESSPGDDELLNALFRVFHTIKGVAGFLSLQAIQALAHATENILDKVRKKEFQLSGHSLELVFSAVDSLNREVESLREGLATGTNYMVHPELQDLVFEINEFKPEKIIFVSKLGVILIEEGKITQADLDKALSLQDTHPGMRLGEIMVEMGLVTSDDVSAALEKQNNARKTVQIKETIKVDVLRLDQLLNVTNELINIEELLTSDKSLKAHASLSALKNMRQLSKVSRQLQEIGFSMRMTSLRSTFLKIERLTRDLAKKRGKQIQFISSGEDIELDKSIIENIGDPIVHMVRNSADHGLETPEERRAAGKSETGKIGLRAFREGENVCIEIEDDGKGLDREAIISQAISQGLIKDPEMINDEELFKLIFRPGFTTSSIVTDISGRGVGMDIVNKSVEALHAKIVIKTQAGQGTTFTIYLPKTGIKK